MESLKRKERYPIRRSTFHGKKGRLRAKVYKRKTGPPVMENFLSLLFSHIPPSPTISCTIHHIIHSRHFISFTIKYHIIHQSFSKMPFFATLFALSRRFGLGKLGRALVGPVVAIIGREVRNSIPFTPSRIHESGNRC